MDRRQRAQAVVARCLEQEEAQWARAIEDACADQPELADEIRAIFQALQDADMAPPGLPRRIGGFELGEPLGEGGMGNVYRARDLRLGREVAVKLVRSDVRLLPDAIERFEREMRAIANLDHPGVVKLLSSGVERGVPYYAMDLVDGITLAAIPRRLRGEDPSRLVGADMAGVLEASPSVFPGGWVETCFRIVAKAARALDHAHRSSVLHRDIKPANIMLTPSGEPILIDFGLARQAGDLQLTRTGVRLGSLPYMAPELWARPNAHSTRTEVYSLGLVLWELLALRPAFVGETEEALRAAILAGSTPRLRSLQSALSRDAEVVCTCAIDVDPARRHAGCAAFAADLESVLALRPIRSRPRGPIGRLRLFARRRPAVALLAVSGAVVATLLTTLYVIRAAAMDAARDFAIRDRRMNAEWALDALTFLSSMGEGKVWPIRPANKQHHALWSLQAQEVLDYLVVAHARGQLESTRYVRPMPGMQPAENGRAYFVPFDAELDRDHSAFLTERSATIAIRALQESIALGSRIAAIAETIATTSLESDEAKAAWLQAAGQASSSGMYPGLRLRPQLGLLPIGTDTTTGRLLFWLVATGKRPDAANGRESNTDPDTGLVLELMPAAEGVERPYLLARQPMSSAIWGRIGFGVPDDRLGDPGPVTNISLNDCRMVLPRVALRFPTPAEWRARYGKSGRPAGILEWAAADAEASEAAFLMPEEDHAAKHHMASKDLLKVTLQQPEIGVRPACDIGMGSDDAVIEAKREFTASSFHGWTCGTTGGVDSGAAWILREHGGNPGACIETVTFSGHAFVLCLHPDAVWDPSRDGGWTDLDMWIDCASLSHYGLGEVVMPIVQQGDTIYFGLDRGVRSGRIRKWHAVGVSEHGPTDFIQIVPRDWQQDPTFLYRGPRVGPDLGPSAKPMRFGFGVYARTTGVYRQQFDNFRLTLRRRR